MDLTATYSAAYDAWNRLVEVKDGANVVLKCEYDGLGRRTKKFVNTSDPLDQTYDAYRHFFYSAAWQILETRKTTSENDAPDGANPEYQFVWSARYVDALVCRDRDADADSGTGDLGVTDSGLDERLYYTTDANMNVTALLDTAGDAVERYLYDPYGNVTVLDADFSADADGKSDYANAILYCGYFFDSETGLYHVRHRMYHLTLGRWLQRDPAGYGDGMSLYEYSGTRPTVATDPMGLTWEMIPHRWPLDKHTPEVACCGKKEYSPKKECCANPEKSEVLPEIPRSQIRGFEVAGQKGGFWGRYLQHAAIHYNGGLIREGFWHEGGPAVPYDPEDPPKEDIHGETTRYPLRQWALGRLRWGDRTGLECRCATAEMIIDCLQHAPKPNQKAYDPWSNNCQMDVDHALHGCCLQGFMASVRPRESLYTEKPGKYWVDSPERRSFNDN